MPLHYAVRANQGEIVRILLELGADPNAHDKSSISGASPLYYAILKRNEELAGLLLDRGAHVYEQNDAGNLLVLASSRNLAALAKKLAETGKFDLNQKARNNSMSALHYAAKAGNLELARYLIEKGANVNLYGEANKTSLHIACEKNDMAMAQMLLEKGANANVYELESVGNLSLYSGGYKRRFGNSPLHYAAQSGNLQLVQLIVESGADINAKSMEENTPLHYAAYHGHNDIIRFLVARGADINARGKIGRETPLSRAIMKKRKATIALIESLGGIK